ncbi:hypothetical protein ABN080_11135 [Proteus sp. fly-1089]|uniref:hypothetical protein n=1 Tax=Proteus sp. fly-1089 TaxID=3136675 RepID=UPI0032DB1B37
MEFKHTPAPWLMDRRSTHAGEITNIHGCKNNDWIEIWSTNWPESEEAQEANAHLIAAAPELLDALIEMQRNGRKQGWDDKYESSMEKTRLAIAKALGQQ